MNAHSGITPSMPPGAPVPLETGGELLSLPTLYPSFVLCFKPFSGSFTKGSPCMRYKNKLRSSPAIREPSRSPGADQELVLLCPVPPHIGHTEVTAEQKPKDWGWRGPQASSYQKQRRG